MTYFSTFDESLFSKMRAAVRVKLSIECSEDWCDRVPGELTQTYYLLITCVQKPCLVPRGDSMYIALGAAHRKGTCLSGSRQQAAIMTHSDHINRSVICQSKQSQSVGDVHRGEARQT